jgi:hypothetical protein
MTLFKRNIGRRVVGVGIGVALLMLGLEAPAFAAVPTVSGIAPTSGRADCIAVITGTAFTDSSVADTTVTFDGPAAADVDATDFAIASATEIWVRVPTLVDGTSYTITITNNGGTASGGTFLATLGAGGCAPTITSFTPTCGLAGAKVVITGTNLLAGTDPSDTTQETEVRFFDYVAATTEAVHVVPNEDTPTSLSVLVPSGAADGPIRVTTDVAAGFSTDPFLVPPPDCTVTTGHTRSITLSLRKHLVARGKVSSTEATPFTDCVASVPVKIQRRSAGAWKTVGKTTTTDTGAYKKRIKDKAGKYRALAPKVTVNDEVCLRAKSPVRRHRH